MSEREWGFMLWQLCHLNSGKWVSINDDKGNPLPGIDGMSGVRGKKSDKTYIGGDFIRMRPGAKFPLHIHEGEHELYIIEGRGFVHVNGKDVAVCAGHLIHIPAEYPHGVWVPDWFTDPLIFVAVGHPHHHIDSRTRMRVVEDVGTAAESA